MQGLETLRRSTRVEVPTPLYLECVSMSRYFSAILVASVILLPASGIRAQAASQLVGNWNLEYERGRRIENGEATPIMGTGKMSIEQRGDSLVATISPGARPDGTVPPPSSFGGKMTPDGAVFVQVQTAQVNINGEASERKITLTWTLHASGDALTGTLGREMAMMEDHLPPTPVTGVRVKRP